MPNHDLEHYPHTEKMLRVGIWQLFVEIWANISEIKLPLPKRNFTSSNRWSLNGRLSKSLWKDSSDFKRVVKCKIAVVFLSEAITKYLKSRSSI